MKIHTVGLLVGSLPQTIPSSNAEGITCSGDHDAFHLLSVGVSVVAVYHHRSRSNLQAGPDWSLVM
ncbi:hypothetical protein FQA47_020177 [Oryzias melastigma]|uniref:Uncharacterized protein n=1 Tax=Oryzias melastigma TaxID=30732 RepID=A0A834BYF1_ORYME|nr:hypothetical protein FQA47_020177 [Oryzias melastigma]